MQETLCFLCGNVVLGLVGQDAVMDTYLIDNNTPEARQVITRRAFGNCHLRCLIQSPYGGFWAQCMARHEARVKRSPMLFENDTYIMYRHDRTKETRLIGKDGWTQTVTDNELYQSVSCNGGYLIAIRHDYNLNFADTPELGKSVQESIFQKQSYPLLLLAQELHVEPYLLYPVAVQNGALRSREPSLSRTQAPEQSHSQNWVSAIADYAYFLPQEAAEILFANVAAPLHALSPDVEKLIKAVMGNQIENVQELLNAGVNVNVRDKDGWTPLMWAVTFDYQEMARLLMNQGARVNAVDNGNDTALTLAVAAGFQDMVLLLRTAGAQQ